MRCRQCGNTQEFNVWLDVGFRVRWGDETTSKNEVAVREFHRAVSDTMPVFCGACAATEVEISEEEWRQFWEPALQDNS